MGDTKMKIVAEEIDTVMKYGVAKYGNVFSAMLARFLYKGDRDDFLNLLNTNYTDTDFIAVRLEGDEYVQEL